MEFASPSDPFGRVVITQATFHLWGQYLVPRTASSFERICCGRFFDSCTLSLDMGIQPWKTPECSYFHQIFPSAYHRKYWERQEILSSLVAHHYGLVIDHFFELNKLIHVTRMVQNMWFLLIFEFVKIEKHFDYGKQWKFCYQYVQWCEDNWC